ncbi:MAG TPA: 3-methyl-2-oxobutanoate hydroxymethyltransferase, partial [Candidatus Deferrimicrobium sp.]|nr:3-methyl-2-oxobutanoate hydroxymethyltransferase [Candidatus Deferrimicrobium sp.]
MKRITTHDLLNKKRANQRISVLTAYDYSSAQLLAEAEIDVVLVGDSLGNVVLGYETTIPVTLDEMIHHTKAVARGNNKSLI